MSTFVKSQKKKKKKKKINQVLWNVFRSEFSVLKTKGLNKLPNSVRAIVEKEQGIII
jgi:hypothetical protein